MKGRGKGITRELLPSAATEELPDDPEEIVECFLDAERRGELYPLYHRLRGLAPAHPTRSPLLPKGTWVLTSHRNVDRVARSASAVNDPKTARVFDYDGSGESPFYRMMSQAMLFLEKPAHDRVRKLVYKAFTPKAVAPLRALTEEVAHELLDAVQDAGEMDFVSQYTYPLPLRAIMRLLGVPEEGRELVEQWAWDFARAGDPPSATPEIIERGNVAARNFYEFFDTLVDERRRRPGDDLISAVITAEEGGQRLTHDEAISTFVLLLQAGHETTADLLGNALVGLFRHPDQLDRLRDGKADLRHAVEELLRYDTSVQLSLRLVVEDLPLDDVTLPAGSIAALVYGAANRDPAAFVDPDRLDLERRPAHLAFSAGSYYCVGNALARTELQAGLRVLFDRVPWIRPARDRFVQRWTSRLRGPMELRVAWDDAPQGRRALPADDRPV